MSEFTCSLMNILYMAGTITLMTNMIDTATAAFLDWVYCGKPRTGVTYDIMRKTCSEFKLALRYCKQHSDMLRSDMPMLQL